MALTMEQLNAIYEDANFSNTSPVNLENMSIYKNNITPINDDTSSGIDTIDIAQNSMIPVNRSNELDYRLNQRGSQNQNLTVEEYNKLLANQEAKPQSNNFLNNFFQGIKNFSPTGILSNIASKADKFSSLPYVDQQYVKENMVYQDPKSGLYRDPYGKNVRSLGLFSDTDGSYGQTQVKEFERLSENITKRAKDKYGVDFDVKQFLEDGTGITGNSEKIKDFLKLNKLNLEKLNFYGKGSAAFINQKDNYQRAQEKKEKDSRARAKEKEAAEKEQQVIESIRQQYAAQGRDYGQGAASQATQDSYQDSQGGYAGASTQDYGGGEKDGGHIDGTNRRRYGMGGIVTL